MTIKINFYHVALTMDCHLPASNTFLVCFSSANSLAFWVFDEHRRMQIGVEKGFHLAHWTSQYLPLNRACTPVGTSVIPGYRVCVLGVGTSATPKSVHSIFAAKCVKDWWLNLTYSEEEVGGGGLEYQKEIISSKDTVCLPHICNAYVCIWKKPVIWIVLQE
jgi:hypothetical protein